MSGNDGLRLREQDLAGKVAIITGASRGIGRAIALNLASRGCSILGTCSKTGSLHHIDMLQHSVSGLYSSLPREKCPKVVGIAADNMSASTPTAIADGIVKHFAGHVDIFVNNSAATSTAKIGEMSDDHIQEHLTSNITLPVKIVDELVKRKLFRKNSRIIYISSVRSRRPWTQQAMYMATKSAGESLCRCWSESFGGKYPEYDFMAGTTANSVMVGLTKTDSIYNNPAVPAEMIPQIEASFVPNQAIPRLGMPEDVADVVGLLCREESRWITGSVVSADAGVVSIV